MAKYPNNNCLSFRPGGYPETNPYKTLTYSQVNERVKALAGAFKSRTKRDNAVGVYGVNCVEWMLTMQVMLTTTGSQASEHAIIMWYILWARTELL